MRADGMTRRQLLKSFGVLGGSSLMLGAMDAWGLKGKPAGPRPQLTGPQSATRVVVLGGGLSGLIVAHELRKLDYDARVLEARDWSGGLMWTVRRGSEHTEVGGERQVCEFDEGQYINVGAWRIPHSDVGILGYCKELGVRLELFVNADDANLFYSENPELGALSGRRVRLREVKADLWGATTELLAKAMNQGNIDVPLSDADKELLLQFLVRSGYLDNPDYVYRPPAARESDDVFDFGALLRSGFGNRARSLNQETGGPAPLFQPIGGMQQIAFAFQRVLGDRMTFGAEVRSIRQTEDEVHVAYHDRRTGEQHEVVADYCVSCLPMSILKTLDVNFSPEMRQAVSETAHASIAKMGLQMRRRFWEEDDGIFGGHLWAPQLQLGEFSYPCNGYFEDKGVLLGYYGSSTQAGLDALSVRDRVEHVITQASKVHPQMRDEFEAAYCCWWEKVPYSMGAYGRAPATELLSRLCVPDRRLYLASAGASSDPSWMEGAVEAAWRAVADIHGRVSRG